MLFDHFDPNNSYASHEGTILAADVVPAGMHAPFLHAYGYLLNERCMAGHAHATDEIYVVTSGSGYVMVGGRIKQVKTGDIIMIPPNVFHTMLCTDHDEAPYTWAALWWDHIDGAEPFGDEIVVKRFDPATAQSGHNNTLLADIVVTPELKTPFGHAFGYLTKGQTMEEHDHPTEEMYIFLGGEGEMMIDGETKVVKTGDVIGILPNQRHSVTALTDSLLWAAFWWDVAEA